MNGKVLLDTNVISALFRGEPSVLAAIKATTEVFVPSIAIGEMYYGAEKSAHRSENVARLDEFVMSSSVLAVDAGTARYYGQIKEGLRTKGRPLPENDIWIAALARQHTLVLATRDRHFLEIDGLIVENW